MSEMFAGVEFTDGALAELQSLIADTDRRRGLAFSISAMLTHHTELRRVRLGTRPPIWPTVKLDKWPARSLWVTEIGGFKIASEEADPIRVLSIWEQ